MKPILSLLLGLLLLTSCKNESNSPVKTVVDTGPQLQQMFIKGYAIKDSSGVKVKDTLQQIQSITYDSLGREKSNIFFNLKGQPQWEDVYVYNEDNHKIGSKYYESGIHKITYKYEIDSLGRRLRYVAFEASSGTAMYDGYSTYQDGGKIRKDGFKDKSGMIRWQYEYLFDEDQNELGYVYIDNRSGERFPSDYKVSKKDSLDRWIERGIFQNDTLVGIEQREYEYQ